MREADPWSHRAQQDPCSAAAYAEAAQPSLLRRSPAKTALNVPGEVDAYTFAVAGPQISLTATAMSYPTGALCMRIYEPSDGGPLTDTCAGTLTFNGQEAAAYTVLIGACVTLSTGSHTLPFDEF